MMNLFIVVILMFIFTPSSNVHYRNTTILIANMKPWHVHFDSLLAYDVWTYKMYILIPWWNVFIFTHENTKNTSDWVSIWNDSNSKIAIKWLFLVIIHGLQWWHYIYTQTLAFNFITLPAQIFKWATQHVNSVRCYITYMGHDFINCVHNISGRLSWTLLIEWLLFNAIRVVLYHLIMASTRLNKGNNKITELRTILQWESQNS